MRCEALGITYEQYMNQPKWWIELSVGKRLVDARLANPTSTLPPSG